MAQDDATREPEPDEGHEGLGIVLLDRQGHDFHPLPDRGAITIGRAESCELRIDRPWISRHHAILHVGDALAIEDVGSHNRVAVADSLLAPHEKRDFAPGDVVTMGGTTLVVQRRAIGNVLQPALARAELLAHIHHELERSRRLGLDIAVVAVLADPPADWDVRVALASMHAISLLGIHARGQFVVAALSTPGAKEAPLARRLEELLRARGISARVDSAPNADGAATPTELVHRAIARAEQRPVPAPVVGDLHREVSALERRRIELALDECEGNQSRAARRLGIARNTLIARMKQYGLTRR